VFVVIVDVEDEKRLARMDRMALEGEETRG